jgi:Flp pilus assembly pilin Flp
MTTDLSLAVFAVALHLRHRLRTAAARRRGEGGQATAEYALVLLGAAVVAIALVTWATRSGRIGQLFDAVFDELQDRL